MKKLSIKILGILIIAIIMLHTSVAIAATNVNQLNNEKQQNNEKINETTEKKQEVTQQKNKTLEEVKKLDSQITDYESQIAELDSKIDDLNNKINESQEKLTKAEKDYTKQEELLETRLVAIQESGETRFLDFLLSSESIVDLISNYYLVTEITTNDTDKLEKIQQQKEEIEKTKVELENNKTELDNSKASKQSVSSQLKTVKSEKDKQVAQLSEDEKTLQAQIDELNEANKTIDTQIKAAQEAVRRYQAQQNNSSSGGASTSPSSSGFIWPVPTAYAKVTTKLYYSSGQYHGAVDFGMGGINGQPVYAVADGMVITSTKLNGSYGNYIIIAHANGLYTLYAHGQDGSRTVSDYQQVKQGQQIMRVGTTGNSTGPHLHFEVRTYPGTYANRQDPMTYLPK